MRRDECVICIYGISWGLFVRNELALALLAMAALVALGAYKFDGVSK